jgi:uncharacterized damage-inducible protein DinB
VITSVDAFLRYFEGVNRRDLRDVGVLPEAAETWKPAAGEGETAWSIGQLVAHMAGSRGFFASAYTTGTWTPIPWPGPTRTRDDWQRALQESCDQFVARLSGTPEEWLHRKIPDQAGGGPGISGWRGLLMMVEHDVHHRSQIDTYAGLNGWEVAQIFGRKAEDVGLQNP